MTENRSRRTNKRKSAPPGSLLGGAGKGAEPGAAGQPIPESLSESIQMLVALMRTVQAHLDEDMTLRELLHLADTQGKNSTRLAALLKAQNNLQPQDDFARLLNKTIDEVLEEIRAEDEGGPKGG
jgi:hypothetical protein